MESDALLKSIIDGFENMTGGQLEFADAAYDMFLKMHPPIVIGIDLAMGKDFTNTSSNFRLLKNS